MKKRDPALQRAIAAAEGPSALADRLGIRPQAVSAWAKCPPERVLDVERITGVSRYQLRPDIYGKKPPHQPST